jgi:DNA-binding GntR family transcriptional regulator
LKKVAGGGRPLLERTTASVAATDALRSMILAGELPAGEPLRQDDLAGWLGISRTPLREAFNRLAAEGLIRMDPHRGAVVSRPNVAELTEIYEVRTILEIEAGSRAIDRITSQDVDHLERLVTTHLNISDPADFAQANAEFHDRIYTIAASQTLFQMISGLRNRSETFIRLVASSPQRIQHANVEHRSMVTALAAHDREALTTAIRQHLETTVASIVALTDESRSNIEGSLVSGSSS